MMQTSYTRHERYRMLLKVVRKDYNQVLNQTHEQFSWCDIRSSPVICVCEVCGGQMTEIGGQVKKQK